MLFTSLLFLAFLRYSAFAQSSQNFWPAAVPLAVRSPYLNAWLPTTNTTIPRPTATWPKFWTGKRTLGWAGYVRVDGRNYQWLGEAGPGNATVLTDTFITPTRSTFTVQAGPLQLKITFFSPIEPDDLALQSFPFSYTYIDITTTDGSAHSVQLYNDISGEWVSGSDDSPLEWDTVQNSAIVYHRIARRDKAKQGMQEANNLAEDDTMYICMGVRDRLSWQTGTDATLRNLFSQSGSLANTMDNNFRPVSSRGADWPVFAISVDLGTIQSTSQPVVWGLGLVRDPSVSVVKGNTTTERSSYFWTKFSTIEDAMTHFFEDFPQAVQRADNLDRKITKALSTSDNYSDLLSLSLRQVMAASEISISKKPNGSFNMSDVTAFMKDIGVSRRTNPVETIYAAFPALLFVNASLSGYILKPLLEYQSVYLQNVSFAISDLGASYPSALTPNAPPDTRGIEDSGSMLIMVLAHAMYSGDGSLISHHYPLLKKWADYLVNNVLKGGAQHTADISLADDQNSVNLAIKGIIGIQAMSLISKVVQKTGDSELYHSRAADLLSQWRTKAFINGHLLLNFDNPSSGGVIYNLFADKLLRLGLVDDSIYQSQEAFYRDQMSNLSGKVGIPLSTGGATGRLDWNMFAAATINDVTTRDAMISLVRRQVSNNATQDGFANVLDVNTGKTTGIASPALGAMFSLIALGLVNQTIIVPPPGQPEAPDAKQLSGHEGLSTGGIVGIVIGVLILVALLIVALLFWRRRRQSRMSPNALENAIPEPFSMTEPGDGTRASAFVSYKSEKRTPLAPWERQEASNPSGTPLSTVYSTVPPSSQADDDVSRRETERLRTDVEELRREMERMRMAVEPPPQY